MAFRFFRHTILAFVLIAVSAWSHGKAVPPAPAAAFGLNTLKLNDPLNSLSTIDVNNTKAPGFNWYVNNAWPLMNANGSAWTPMVTSAATPSSYLSIISNQLQISDDASKLDSGIQSAVSTGTGSTFNGTVYSGSMYVEFTMLMDPTQATTTAASWQAWPIVWMVSKEFATGQITNTDFVEPDLFEVYPTGNGTVEFHFAAHQWNTSTGFNIQNINVNQSSFFSGFNFAIPHKYAMRYITAAANAGTGLFDFYVDDVHVTAASISFTASGPAFPGMTPSNPNGALSMVDNESFILVLSAGHPNWTARYGNFRVWQYLLNRDLHHDNDNSPAFLEKVG